jgi:hypothetical protein
LIEKKERLLRSLRGNLEEKARLMCVPYDETIRNLADYEDRIKQEPKTTYQRSMSMLPTCSKAKESEGQWG